MTHDDEARRRILERRAQFIRAAITSAGIGTASLAVNACDNPMAQPCLEPPPVTNPPSAQPCLEPMPLPKDAGAPDAAQGAANPSAATNPSAAPSASANTAGTPVSGTTAPRGSASSPPKPPPPPTQTVVKPHPMPCLKPVMPPKSR